MTTYPAKIKFLSDDTEAKFIGEVPSGKEKVGKYEFTKAKVNKGVCFTMGLQQIERLISDNSIKAL